jgi:sensor histidine kinase regulating citrate/malate metabolism
MKKESAKSVDLRLLSTEDIVVLSVCDDGEMLSAEIEKNLFAKPVSSGSGMGIGLYQASIMAHAFNYELELSQNERGRVCFNLFQHLAE